MNLAESFPILLLIVSLAAALLVTVLAWRYRARRSVKTFFAVMLALDWWLLCSVLENNSTSLATHVFWMNMSYLGITLLPALWLLFTLYYTDKGEWWRRRGLPLLFIIPAITLVMVWTNGWHHLMWSDVSLDTSVYPPLKIFTFHTWFWVHAFYSYALLIIGFVRLVGLYVRTSGLYRRQVRIMLAATIVPWVANILFIFGVVPNFPIDPTPMAFVITGLAFLWGFSLAKLLNIIPVAYEAIFRSISDGVIVIDAQNRIRQFNPAAARILPAGEAGLTGKKLGQVIPARAYISETLADSGRSGTVISLGTGHQARFYKVSVTAISDGQNVSGRMVLLHDDTERRKAENESREKVLLKTELNERKKTERLQHDENYVLTLMSRGAKLNEILDAIVRLVEAHNTNIIGSILLYDKSSAMLLPAACPSLPANLVTLFKDGVPVGPESGACAAAAFRKERVIVPDIRQSPLFDVNRAALRKATRNKLLACWSEPIISSNGEILGTIANYQGKVGEPDADDLKVLEWSARIAAIAIEQRRSEQALADEAVRRRILIEQSSDGIVVLDQSGRVYEANQRFADMLGYSLEEARQLSVWDWEADYPREQVVEMINTVDENGDHFETRHRRKDDSFYDVEISTNGAAFAGRKLIFCVCRDITERKRAEEALRESEEKFSKAFRSSPNSICISTLEDGTFLEVNDSFTRDTGWTRQETIGHSSLELGLWADPEERERILGKMHRDGRVVNEEYRCRIKSGEIRTQLFSAEPISFDGKDCILAVTADITERKQMEEKIRESEEKYHMIFESGNDIIILLDKKGKIIDINQQITTIGGYDRNELLGEHFRTLTKLMPPKSLAIIAKNFMLRLLGAKVPTYEVEMYRANGERLNVEINAAVIKDNDKPIGTLATLRDVTERRKSESALRYQRELIGQIIATIPNAVLVTNKDKEVLLANNTFYQTFGLTKEDIENKPVTRALRVKEFSDALTAIIKTREKSLSFEFRYRLQNVGHIFAAGIVKMENNRYLIFMNDVTEEREKQERLYLTDRLASVGEMASGVAHELNNPLTSIIGLSGLLIRQEMPAEQREDLVAVHAEAERCAAIVKNLLTFARKHAPKREPIQVTKILEDVLKLRAYEQRGQNITIQTDFAPDLPEVLADYFQMQQVFLNIILNAEMAMVDAHGRGTLKITSRRVDSHVDISFKDDGPGIAKENLGLIFNPFFTTKEVGKGTGLGLSISYGIVASHGGRIYAKSPSARGTTFVVELPVLKN